MGVKTKNHVAHGGMPTTTILLLRCSCGFFFLVFFVCVFVQGYVWLGLLMFACLFRLCYVVVVDFR